MNRIFKISFLLFAMFSIANVYGQKQPDGVSFQAVARDANGNAAAFRTIYVKLGIIKSTATGENVYSETFQVTSNGDGIFTVIIGKGTRISGLPTLLDLDWRSDIYFVNLRMAIAPSIPTPGWNVESEYVDLGTSQIWAVPYALYATRSIYADSAQTITAILPGNKGGTGVRNDGKTITLGGNFELKGLGNLTFNTKGNTNITLPLSGTMITTDGIDTLTNKTIVSPILTGVPTTPTADSLSDDSTVANTRFVKRLVASSSENINVQIQALADLTKASTNEKLNISDTAAMLSDRFTRDTASLSSRIDSTLKLRDTALMLSTRFKRDTTNLSKRIDDIVFSSGVSLTSLAQNKLNISDTSEMLSKRIQRDTTSLSNRINSKLGTQEFRTTISSYLDSVQVLKLSDTSAMLSARIERDTTSLSNRINLKLNISDTATMLSNRLKISDTSSMLNSYALKFKKNHMVNLGRGIKFGRFNFQDSIPTKGRTLDDILQDIITDVTPPIYDLPTVSISPTPAAGIFEIGTKNIAINFSYNYQQNDAGLVTPPARYQRLESGHPVTDLAGASNTIAELTTTIQYQVIVNYARGPVKNNSIGIPDSTGIILAGSATSIPISFTPEASNYYGTSTTNVISDSLILAASTFHELATSRSKPLFNIPITTGVEKYIFYAYPQSYGNLMTDDQFMVGIFQSLGAFTLIQRNVINAQGYTQAYNIYVSNNYFTEDVNNIIIN